MIEEFWVRKSTSQHYRCRNTTCSTIYRYEYSSTRDVNHIALRSFPTSANYLSCHLRKFSSRYRDIVRFAHLTRVCYQNQNEVPNNHKLIVFCCISQILTAYSHNLAYLCLFIFAIRSKLSWRRACDN